MEIAACGKTLREHWREGAQAYLGGLYQRLPQSFS